MIKNNLKIILADRDISINKLSEMTGIRYGTLFAFVKRREIKIDKSKQDKKDRPPSLNLEILDKVCETLELTPGEILVYEPDKE